MKTKFAVVVLLCLGTPFAQAQVATQLVLQRTFALPAGTGKFDHFAIDLQANRLFVAATGNHTVEILNLDQGKVTEMITGLGKPHGLAWIAGRLYASDGSMGDLKVFEGAPLKRVKSIKLSEDADDLVYDAGRKLLYVGHGGSDADNPAKIAVIDTANQTLIKDLPVATHPEGLDIDNAKSRIFVNVADSAEVAVIDGATQTLSGSWKISRAADNVPIAFDGEHNLLFVACRTPGAWWCWIATPERKYPISRPMREPTICSMMRSSIASISSQAAVRSIPTRWTRTRTSALLALRTRLPGRKQACWCRPNMRYILAPQPAVAKRRRYVSTRRGNDAD
jgi:hypothetical protein